MARTKDTHDTGRHRGSGKGYGFGVLVGLGTLLVIAGVIGLIYAGVATITTMILFGWLLLIGGVIGLVQAVESRKENAFWLVVAVAALNIAAGIILLRRPEVAAATLTLFVALLLLGAGIFRVVGGVASMTGTMFWTIFVGAADIVLGLLVLAEWPSSSLYAIGTFVSLALLIDGLSLVGLGLTGRRIVGMVRDTEHPEARHARPRHDAGLPGADPGPTEWRADEPAARDRTRKGPDTFNRPPDEH